MSDVRQALRQLLQVALTAEHPAFRKADARDEVFWFCQDVEELLEAVYLLQQKETMPIEKPIE